MIEPLPPLPRLTDVPDLTGMTLAGLRELDLEVAKHIVLGQVRRPRVNLGGSAPPGRSD